MLSAETVLVFCVECASSSWTSLRINSGKIVKVSWFSVSSTLRDCRNFVTSAISTLILTLLCFRHCCLLYKLNAPSAKPNLPFSRFIFVISDERFTAYYNFRNFPGKTGNNRRVIWHDLRILAVSMTITTKCSLLYTRHSNFERQV